jgi:hypothetical protein
MKYHFLGTTFIGSGLILILIYFIVLFPASDQGGWTAIIFPIFFLIFLLGVLDIICGLLNLIKQKAYERLSTIVGIFSLIVGFLYIYMWWYIFWWLGLLLFISGTFLLYLGKAKSLK